VVVGRERCWVAWFPGGSRSGMPVLSGWGRCGVPWWGSGFVTVTAVGFGLDDGSPFGIRWCRTVFAAARYAAIVVKVMNRSVARGQLPPDHTIWLDNPVTPCLAELLHHTG